MPLDPKVKELLYAMEKLGAKPVSDMTPEEARRYILERPKPPFSPPPIARSFDRMIQGPGGDLVFSPTPVGHTVERISLTEEVSPQGDITYRGQPSDFVAAMDRPLPMITGPDGNLVVGDYATGVIYRVTYGGE